MIFLERNLKGRILDIGGGGEGVIGRLYGPQVIAIDNCPEELEELPKGFEKRLMDATALEFEDKSFDHVTFFYSLMYMTAQEQQQALGEAARVLKKGGTLHIWDCDIASASPEPFCLMLDICLPEERLHTTYGIGKSDSQSRASIWALCRDAGLSPISSTEEADGFYLCWERTAL